MTIKQLVMLVSINNSIVLLGGLIAGDDIAPHVWPIIGIQVFILLFWCCAELGYRKAK